MLTDLEETQATRKRLLWRATHRGIKEMDIIVGRFAALHLESMTAAELTAFSEVLDIPDQDLLAWLTSQEQVPPTQMSPMLTRLLAFRPQL
jgi:antitoxin CptB